MHHENRQNVVPLDDLNDFEVADDNPDVRGWDVVTSDGRKVGEVDELLVDTAAMKVRYLDIELDKEIRGSDRDRHVLIPIGQARLDDRDDRVLIERVNTEQLRTMPAYNGQLDRGYEDSLRSHFGTSSGSRSASERDYYSGEHFDDSRFYGARRGSGAGARSRAGREGSDRDRHDREDRLTLSEERLAVGKRQHEAGEVHVKKHVETEHVREEVPVRREEAQIERRPIPEGERMDARTRIQDDEIRIPLREEEVVTEKRTVPKEELVVKKREVEETKVVEADLKKERAEIHRHDDKDGKSRNRR
jgi:uncharacterized protein (TIGR02271 family)